MIIYLITNMINGRQYVGQTRMTKEKRWRGHCSAAKVRNHTVLGAAIHKYGRDSFSIEEIDKTTSLEHLCELEAFHAKRLNTYVPNGYNVEECGVQLLTSELVNRRAEKLAKEYQFLSPSGETVTVRNIASFCRERGLDPCHMYHVAQGKRVAHKGWRTIKEAHRVCTVNNVMTGEIKKVIDAYGFKRKIALEMGVHEASLLNLIAGKCHSAGDWVLMGVEYLNAEPSCQS